MSAYPGGLITLNPPATTGPGGLYNDGGTASGMWRLDQALVKQKQSLWPTKSKTKEIYSFGTSSYGAHGDGFSIARSSPVQVALSANWATWKAGSIATQSNGTLWTWGQGSNGQIGDNTTIARSFPTQVGTDTNWGTNLNSVAQGDTSKFAIRTTGTLWAMGAGSFGRLGLNNDISKSSPTQIGAETNWSQITSSTHQNMGAIKTDGSMYLWGFNGYGGLAQNNAGTYRSSPMQVAGTWSFVSPGYRGGAALKADNSLWVWGINGSGLLGIDEQGATGHRSSPVQVTGLWTAIVMGDRHCLGVKSGGSLWSWGGNIQGHLGSNNNYSRSSPGQVGALTNWSKVACSRNFSAAIKTDGTFWTWGQGSSGALGLNESNYTASRRSSPVQVGTNTDWVLVNTTNGYLNGGVRAF